MMSNEICRTSRFLLTLAIHDGGDSVIIKLFEAPKPARIFDIGHCFDIKYEYVHGGALCCSNAAMTVRYIEHAYSGKTPVER